MVDKTNPESGDSIAQKSSEELFLRGSEKDEMLRKKTDEDNLKLEDSQEEVNLQNIQRGSEQRENPNLGVEQKGSAATRDESLDESLTIKSEEINTEARSYESKDASNPLNNNVINQQQSSLIDSEKNAREADSRANDDQDTKRVLFNLEGENGDVGISDGLLNNSDEELTVNESVEPVINAPDIKDNTEDVIVAAPETGEGDGEETNITPDTKQQPNTSPVAGEAVAFNVNEGASTVSGQIAASDADPGASLGYQVIGGISMPDGFLLSNDGNWQFDAQHLAYDHLSPGDSVVLTVPVEVTDEFGASDTTQIQITVMGTNDAPVVSANTFTSVDEATASIAGQLASSDVDDAATSSWSISVGSTTPDGFIFNADGSYSFDPANASYEHLNVGDSKVFTVPVSVTDEHGATDTAQIQITVQGTNDAPIAGANVIVNVNEGATTINGQLVSSDVDDGATANWSVSAGSTAPDGFILNSDGVYSFDPVNSSYEHLKVGDSEIISIPVTISDDNGASDTVQIQITVSGTNNAPVAGVNVVTSVDEGGAVINGQITSSDVDDGNSVIWSVAAGGISPDGFVLSSDGTYSFDPSSSTYDHLNVGDSTTVTIPVTVTDEHGATDTAQIQITVSGTNDVPVAGASFSASTDEGATIINGQLLSSDLDDGATASWSVSTGSSAPDSFVINTDGSYSFDPADASYDHLNVGDSEVLTIPITVTDDNGATDTAQIQITVQGTNDAPVAGASVLTSVDEGAASISGQLTSTDVDDVASASFAVSTGSSVPPGFVLNSDGSYSFDPADSSYEYLNIGDSEVLTVPVIVADEHGASDTTQIQITVNGTNDAPVAGASVIASVDEGMVAINGQLTSTDVDDRSTATFTISAGVSTPAGFVLSLDGAYSFDPADNAYDHLNVGDTTVLTVPVTVIDDNGATDTAQIQIIVNGTNDVPVAGASVLASVDEGAASINGQLTSTDVDNGTTASWSVSPGGTVPDGFVLNADGSYRFDPADSSYDHLNVGDSEVLTIPVTVTDDNGATDVSQIQITVSGTNDAPVAGAAVTVNVEEGSASISGQLTSTDLDAGATATFAVSSGNTAPDGFVINADGSYSFDPADSTYDHLNVGDNEVLTIPVTVTDDNGATDTSQIQITVSGTNDAPIASAAVTANVDEGSATISGQLTASDLDDGAASTFTVSFGNTAPDGFVLNADGSYLFDPADTAYDHLNVGDSEVLTIPVTVTDDNGATDISQIQITISGTNDAPVAGAAVTANVDEGSSAISGQLTSSDLDDGATATFTISSGNTAPDGFVLNTDGSYSFDPADSSYDHLNVGDSEVLTVPVTVTDDNGATDTSQIQITISGTNDAPIAGAAITANVDEGSASISGQLTASDVDDGAIATFSVSSGNTAPDGFVINVDGSYSFDPADSAYDHLNVGDSEVLTVPITVTDDNGETDTSQIQITVSGTNDAPIAGASVISNVDEGSTPISGQLTSSDVDDGATATFTVSSGNTAPDGFVLIADGSYSFDPADSAYDHLNVGDSEVLTIPVTVTDDNGATDVSQIQITVSGTNDAPVAGAVVTANVDEGSASISGQLTASDMDDGAAATFSISSGNTAPDGFVINADGSYSFDPADSAYDHLNVGDSEVLTIPVTVTDDNGATDISQIQITVSGTNDAPVAGAAVTASVDEGSTSISGQLTSTDVDDGATAAFTVSSGNTAPDGFVINTDGSYSFDPADSAYDHLNVGDSEVLTIPVTVTDDNGATDTSQIQITVSGTNDAPVAGASVISNVDEGSTPISGQLTSSDVDDGATATFTVSSGNTAPYGFVLIADGSYSFDPADSAYDHLNVGDSEILTVPITVTDDNGATDTSQIQITVSGTNDAPVAGASVISNVDEGSTPISGQLTSSDVDDGATATFTVSSGNTAPDGFVINADGSYSFDPADSSYDHLNVGDSEVLAIPVTVTDDQGQTDTSQIQITVSGANDAPIAGAAVTANVDEGSATISGQLTASDLDDGATATFAVSSGSTAPDGFIINADGSYSFDPADSTYDHLKVGDNEVLTIPVTVTDDNGATDTSQIQITVSGTNDAPIAGAAVTANVDEGSATISGQLTASDLDDGATATFAVSSGSTAPDGFIINADGSYSFDPADSTYDHLNVGDNEVLTIPVTVTDDNGATDTSQIQITVSGTNDAPIAGASVISNVDEGSTPISGQLTASDVDDGATATFTVSSGNTAPYGFVLIADGSYSFDPADSAYDHLNVGDSEVLTIPVTVTDDNGATDTSQIQITVSGTNDAPVAGAAVTASVDEGSTPISGQLASTDLDDGAAATFTISSGNTAPDGFVLNTDGSYSFDPADSSYDHLNVGDSEVLTIPVTVTDDQGATDTSQIQITVSGTNDVPVAGASVSSSVDEDASIINGQLTSNDLDDGATASWSVSTGSAAPDGFVINADGSYSFDPADSAYDHLSVGDSTVLTIPVAVTDDNGETDTAQIQITVNGTNDSPVAGVSVNVSVDEGSASITGQLTSTDLDDGATASWSMSSGSTAPDGFVINVDGSYSFDPADSAYDHLSVGDSEVISIPVTVTDNNGASDTTQIQITVQGTNDAPTAIAFTGASVNENAATGTVVAQMSTQDIDDGETFTYSIIDDASGLFEVAGEQIVVKAGVDVNYEAAASHDVNVQVTDANGSSYTQSVTLTVNDVNDAPADIVFTGNAVDESSLAGTVVAALSTVDDDAGETFSYTLNDSSGFFELSGDQIVVKAGANIDFETAASHDLSVQVTDSGGNTYAENFTINVNDIYEGISAVVDVDTSLNTVVENVAIGTYTGITLEATDADGDAISYAIDGNAPFAVDVDGRIVTDGNLDFNTTDTYSLNVTATSADGTISTNTFAVDVTQFTGVTGTGRNDHIEGADGNDVIYGGDGNDHLAGGDGNDALYGEAGNDHIEGGAGNDILTGGAGNDKLEGGAGDDVLSGGSGKDRAFGEDGNDTYVVNPFDGSDYFAGGDGGGWTDAIDVSAIAANDPDNPWAVEVDGVQLEYDIAAGALELNPDTAGVITFGDGSELSFDGVEKIEW